MSLTGAPETIRPDPVSICGALARAHVEGRGYFTCRGAIRSSALQEVQGVIDRLISSPSVVARRFLRVQRDSRDPKVLLQLELSHIALLALTARRSEVFAICSQLAGGILGVRPYYLFDHAIYKMPKNRMGTPWHQDQAYLGPNTIVRSVHFWIPFQDTSEENGTLSFADREPEALLPHRRVNSSGSGPLCVAVAPAGPIHVLEAKRGDISIHTNLTLHSAAENNSDQTRKAWVLHFGDRPAWYKHWLQLRSRFASNRG